MLAFGFWLASLAFGTLTSYSDRTAPVPGWSILAFGWLSLLGYSAAWLANPCLLLALIVRNNAAPLFAGMAALVSLHTFFLADYPNGSGNTAIFGYGWGVLLWFIAIGLVLLRVGLAASDPAKPGISSDFAWMRHAGILWIGVTVILTGYYAYSDRAHANTTDSALLKRALFKRGTVCTLEPYAPAAIVPIDSTTIVEIAKHSGIRMQDLLRWGVPTVRVRNHDYSQTGTERDRILKIIPARGTASVLVDLKAHYDKETREYSDTLKIRTPDQRESTMVWNHDGPVRCPRKDVKKTILSALGLAELPPDNTRVPDFVAAQGMVIEQEPAPILPPGQNQGCQPGIGFSYETSTKLGLEGSPFIIGNNGYLLPYPARNALCTGDSTYFYDTHRSSDSFVMGIAKRDAQTLELKWFGRIQIKNAPPALQENRVRVLSIEEKGDEILVKTQHTGHDQTLLIQATHPQTLPASGK